MSNCSSPRSVESRVCSFYINACPPPDTIGNGDTQTVRTLPMEKLLECIQNLGLEGNWWVGATACGLLLTFNRVDEANSFFDTVDIAKVLEGPVQVASLPTKSLKLSPTSISHMNVPMLLSIRDVPWSIPVEDIQTALEFQGVNPSNIERFRQNVRIEVNPKVSDIMCTNYLLVEGLNFYGVAKFPVILERPSGDHHQSDNDVLQCYRCQGFWHVALNCKHIARCVRCGDSHSVEFCPRPRTNPLCCNCSGHHHAAYKNCPVRKQMVKSAAVSFTLSAQRPLNAHVPCTITAISSKPTCSL